MTIEQKRRELFEDVFSMEANLAMSADHPGEYQADFVRHYWYAFNAALDAVVIELPTVDRPSHAGTEWIQVAAQDEYKHRVTAAIESTGLGLKVMP